MLTVSGVFSVEPPVPITAIVARAGVEGVWLPPCRLSVYRVEQPRCHTATYGVSLSKAYEMDCQRRSGDPTWVMLQSLNNR
jgi:hypothetical protein